MASHEARALAFVGIYERDPTGDWRNALATELLAERRRIRLADWDAVERIVESELIARGILVPSPDYEPPETDE